MQCVGLREVLDASQRSKSLYIEIIKEYKFIQHHEQVRMRSLQELFISVSWIVMATEISVDFLVIV